MGLPVNHRLTRKDDFRLIMRRARKIITAKLVVYVAENRLPCSRLAVVMSAKFGNSVVRHRVKRLLREAFRLNLPKFVCPVDVIVFPRHYLTQKPDYHFVEAALLKSLRDYIIA